MRLAQGLFVSLSAWVSPMGIVVAQPATAPDATSKEIAFVDPMGFDLKPGSSIKRCSRMQSNDEEFRKSESFKAAVQLAAKLQLKGR